jgi:hypothetical protein
MSAGMNAALWSLRRLAIVMEPDLGDPREAAGVLNPVIARGPDASSTCGPASGLQPGCLEPGGCTAAHARRDHNTSTY